jgi:hypothetical protein
VITGFNTDIEFQGTTYHVQTEDKGIKTPLILSLVYDRGTILASKRSAYNDLLIGNLDEKILAERLQKQHNLICAAVRTGRIEDLKRMAAKEAALKQQTPVVEKKTESADVIKPAVEENSSTEKVNTAKTEIRAQTTYQEKLKSLDRPPAEQTRNNSSETFPTAKHQIVSKPNDELIWDVPISVVDETIVEAVQIVGEELILSDEAVEVITDFAESDNDSKLKIRLIAEEKFKSGDRKTLRILVSRGKTVKGLSGIQVIIKILGSAFTPLIYHAKTDINGIATVDLEFPRFRTGRAAILIKVSNDGEDADLRRSITHE